MGRYYSGDIEGKFWFGLQSSLAADRFGVTHSEPDYVEYWFQKEDLQGVLDEIDVIEKNLGSKLKVIKEFFEKNNGYNDAMLQEADISRQELNDYADLLLGIQIADCIKENGGCSFTAEL